MPVQKIPGIIKREILFSGGVDESSAANVISNEDCLEMENFRLSRDGKRTVKRLGLTQSANPEAKDIFGHTTYYDATPAFCEIIVTESAIWRKVAAAAWSNRHTLASTLTHPVRILDIHDKQIIITEDDNRFINAAGNDYKMGIDAPTTLPTVTEAPIGTLPLDDDMNYADQAAMDAVWTDGDNNANSVLSASDPNSDEGPDADSKYMRLYDTAYSQGNYAQRSKTVEGIPAKYSLELDVYFDEIGWEPWHEHLLVEVYSGATKLRLRFARAWVDFYDGDEWQIIWGSGHFPGQGYLRSDGWQNWKFIVDTTTPSASTIQLFYNDIDQGTWNWNNQDTTASQINLRLYTGGVHYSPDVYIDRIRIGGASDAGTSGELTGFYKYATTFMRSGNYGAESNPIKCLVGAATHSGSGTGLAAVCTTGGTYTGAESKDFRVRIDGTDPDTYEWSENDGETWSSTDIPVVDAEAVLLSYGVTILLRGTTNHVLGDYWTFTCTVCSVSSAMEQVTLSVIPTDSNSANTGTDRRRLYRTTAGGARYYWLATIHDNTTTTFVDNKPDSMLGDELQEDHDVLPNGRFSVWWDNRLWVSGKMFDADDVAMDTEENLVYYSRVDEPEHFDLDNRYVITRKGDTGDEISGMIAYKDNLYVFKRNSIYIIQKKSYGLYGRYLINTDIGCVAPWSLIEVNNLLMFLSYRGWEVYNGSEPYSMTFSVPLTRTLNTIDTSAVENFGNGAEPTTTGYNKIVSTHLRKRNEVWMSIPYRTGSLSPCTVVYNYARNKFYIFVFHKTPTYLGDARDSDKAIQNYMGTGDGYLFLCDVTYRDDTTNITAKIRKGWIESIRYADWRRIEVEFEIPNGKILTMNCYMNFDKDVARTDTMIGVSLHATDIELRRVIRDFSELGLRGKYFAVEFTNAENLAGDLKLNKAYIYYHLRAIKGRIEGD